MHRGSLVGKQGINHILLKLPRHNLATQRFPVFQLKWLIAFSFNPNTFLDTDNL